MICRFRNANPDAGLHARYGHLVIHHETFSRRRVEQAPADSDQRYLHLRHHQTELLYGVKLSPRRSQDQAALDAYIRHVQVLDYPDEAALHYAQIRAALKVSGAMIGANDLFIAAHARSLELTLVTNNTREFSRVEGLRLENWTEPQG